MWWSWRLCIIVLLIAIIVISIIRIKIVIVIRITLNNHGRKVRSNKKGCESARMKEAVIRAAGEALGFPVEVSGGRDGDKLLFFPTSFFIIVQKQCSYQLYLLLWCILFCSCIVMNAMEARCVD